MTDATPSLSEQALENLVNQFARPLDFLRELVQNSIDAGSPRVDVWVSWDPPDVAEQGILTIGVDDYGDGMDEAIINDQLLSLYASTKEDDLTKIGKFGIGFTSIFAIQPDRVLLHTGRHGQYWELMAGPDRVWQKHRSNEPVTGTRITLFKLLDPERLEPFIEEARAVLTYWCEHSSVPITFHDRRRASAETTDGDDPFGAFHDETSTGPDQVNGPMNLSADLVHRWSEPGTEVVIGYAARPRYGFYNGGLTLLNTVNEDVLGPFKPILGQLSFKVKNDHLEHTLTRDNVLQDDAWRDTMNRVVRAHRELRERLVDRCCEAVAQQEPVERWHAALAAECQPGSAFTRSIDDRPLFRTVLGRPFTLSALRQQEARVGQVLVGSEPNALHTAVQSLGLDAIVDGPGTRMLLDATRTPPMFEWLRGTRPVRSLEEVFVLPMMVDETLLPAAEQQLLDRTRSLLASAVGLHIGVPLLGSIRWAPSPTSRANRITVLVGDFGGMNLGRHDTLALNGPGDGRVFRRPEARWMRLPSILSWRCLLVNRQHPLFRSHVLSATDDLDLAAVGLAQALLHTEGIEGEGTYQRLLDAAFGASA